MRLLATVWRGVVVIVILAVVLPAAVAPVVAGDPPAIGDPPVDAVPVKKIKMYAENWKWTPDVIRVDKGTKLEIRVESFDAPHSFELKAFGLKVRLPEGETTTIEFVADKAGEFDWRCGRPCGNGCPKMRGKLIVAE